MPTPPEQNIPPLRKVNRLQIVIAVTLQEPVPKVCDIAGWVLSRSIKDLTRAAAAYRSMMSRAYGLGRGRVQLQYWSGRWQSALKQLAPLNQISKALDGIGALASGVSSYQESAKGSWYGKGYDAAVGGLTDFGLGVTTKAGSGPLLAVADTVADTLLKGGGLGSLVKGVAQGLPVSVADPMKFHEESSKGTYGAHSRLISGYTDFATGDSNGLADFHEQSLKGELGGGFWLASQTGEGVSGVGASGIRWAEETVHCLKTGDMSSLERLGDQIRRGEFGSATQGMLYFHEHVMMGGVRDNGGRLFGQ